MAAKLLLPGFGGAYTSESFTTTAVGADTIDASRCGRLAIQIAGTAATGSIDLQQSFIGVSKWSTIVPTMSVTDATAVLIPDDLGPFGVLRLNSNVTGGTCTVTIVGFPYQGEN